MLDDNYYKMLNEFYEGVYVVDNKRKILFWNKGSERITGYTKEEVTNSFCFNNILNHVDQNGKHLCHDGCPLQETIMTGKVIENRVFLHHKNGHRVPVMVKSMPIYDESKNIIAAIEIFSDTDFQKDAFDESQRLKKLVLLDELTNLPNRRYIEQYLKSKYNEVISFKSQYGLLFFDIDHFKHVNDNYGHQIGDEILKMLGNTLRKNTRSSDFVGRYGGEEFIAVLGVTDESELVYLAEKLRNLVRTSAYSLDNNKALKVTVSIGGTMIDDKLTISENIEKADKNMYIAKENGRDRVKI
ncbi:sensor domain-containing diguanylate cyclase [Candidatus Izimaplasma bacterium ZiA1]|uniref:GGDEF domain-containing protein n=1 Tax=Candidatus Izimoplasma sp. ZiA1 TaxID=2024899 RepID=UPI001438D5DC